MFPRTPPDRNWRVDPSQLDAMDDLIAEVMRHWDAGKNTAEIAQITFESEAAVARALRIGRERRREEQ
ncbi:MAG: hypothetical protein IT537_08640 [Hyphomicrobiales bacterium]|nr:hypothetical protein [Hyphomicrobiales bacterium]